MAKASSDGANTVKGPGPFKVSTKFAAFNAAKIMIIIIMIIIIMIIIITMMMMMMMMMMNMIMTMRRVV